MFLENLLYIAADIATSKWLASYYLLSITKKRYEKRIAPIRYKPDKELATDVFKNNDDFFLYFKSPVNGYLTIFLFDIAANQAYCMLPYQDSGSGSYPITFGQDYYFFSPNKYGRALSKNDQQQRDDGLVIPSSLDYKDFNKWLMKCQQKDEEMEVRRIPIKIINK